MDHNNEKIVRHLMSLEYRAEEFTEKIRVLETQVKLLIQAMEQATALINILNGDRDETTKR